MKNNTKEILNQQLQQEMGTARKAVAKVVYPYVVMILSPVVGTLLAILITQLLF